MRKATTASFGRFQSSPKPPQVKESRYCAQTWVRESDSLDIEIIEAIADGVDTLSAISEELEFDRSKIAFRIRQLINSEVLSIVPGSNPAKYTICPIPKIISAICKK